MELPCDREIVGGTARLAAQLPERKDGNALQRLWNVQRPSAADVEVEARHMRAVLGRIVGEAEEGGRQRGGRGIVGGNEPACAIAQPVAPVIGWTLRSAQRRGGKGCTRTCRSRWSHYH